ncbi:hypothetical protein [Chryseobacterium rhizosphaerae]|jgi:ABC-type microcin C transport system permease subunit YejE|uniref:Lipoprotein n=1 Tax=Chryseobacterium rhizosphaerae TaxID=395937 RepID=A0ABX9INK9_9FLAO|nr:hypothetical protein [Chryseobacterium rhizosphaerae]MDC8100855.1 hypothetical protein [Chryseobacterium rhizosphaerae]REC77294.1 hypothetical protein DRF57_04655 [Chryseobacterium rhizosphaerae]GEN65717.1 hypothetical protein CRH01_02850 [Chryseobacterium rhizosphaerae]
MYRYFLFVILIILTNSCENKKDQYSFKNKDIRNVSFSLPSNFLLKKANAEDSEVYDIFHNNKIIGSCYYGRYYKPFVEEYSVTEEKEIYQKVKSKEAKIYYSKYLEQDYKNGIYNDNYYYYDTINKNIAQVMLPKKESKGLVGIYFDSVDIHKNKFAIISSDLSEENKKRFLDIFKTIKIK